MSTEPRITACLAAGATGFDIFGSPVWPKRMPADYLARYNAAFDQAAADAERARTQPSTEEEP